MKTSFKITLVAVILLFITGCTQNQNAPLTPQEMDQIKSEVKAASEPLFTGWATLDGNTALKSFSAEMVSCYDTLLLDYPSYQKSWEVYTEARDSIKITPIHEDYIILTKDLVIETWVGKVVEWMKSGEKVTYNPIRYTNLFKQANGQWKIVFAQSTGIPVKEIPVK